jgi:hypothetical protein
LNKCLINFYNLEVYIRTGLLLSLISVILYQWYGLKGKKEGGKIDNAALQQLAVCKQRLSLTPPG